MSNTHFILIHLNTCCSWEKWLQVFAIWRFANMSDFHLVRCTCMSTGYAASQWNDGTPTIHCEQNNLCGNFKAIILWQSHSLDCKVYRAIAMVKKSGRKIWLHFIMHLFYEFYFWRLIKPILWWPRGFIKICSRRASGLSTQAYGRTCSKQIQLCWKPRV